jgi:hypothetical protein
MHYQNPCRVIIPNWRTQYGPYRHPFDQSLHQVNHFDLMPGYQITQETGPSELSSRNDGNSTNSTGSNTFTHRSDAPEGQNLAQRIFAAYKKQENNTRVTSLIRRNDEASKAFWGEFTELYRWCEGQLERPICVASLRMFNAYWDRFDGVEGWSLEVHTAVRDLVNPYP